MLLLLMNNKSSTNIIGMILQPRLPSSQRPGQALLVLLRQWEYLTRRLGMGQSRAHIQETREVLDIRSPKMGVHSFHSLQDLDRPNMGRVLVAIRMKLNSSASAKGAWG